MEKKRFFAVGSGILFLAMSFLIVACVPVEGNESFQSVGIGYSGDAEDLVYPEDFLYCDSSVNIYEMQTNEISHEITADESLSDESLREEPLSYEPGDEVIVTASGGQQERGGGDLLWFYYIFGEGLHSFGSPFSTGLIERDVLWEWTNARSWLINSPDWMEVIERPVLIALIEDFNITKQALIYANEQEHEMSMAELDYRIYNARNGILTPEVEGRGGLGYWRYLLSSSDINALFSGDVYALWNAFPGFGIFLDGNAYSPAWVLQNLDIVLSRGDEFFEEIALILEMAAFYPDLDAITLEATETLKKFASENEFAYEFFFRAKITPFDAAELEEPSEAELMLQLQELEIRLGRGNANIPWDALEGVNLASLIRQLEAHYDRISGEECLLPDAAELLRRLQQLEARFGMFTQIPWDTLDTECENALTLQLEISHAEIYVRSRIID
ncbi:MAG: hypothetical protein FWC70_07850 [Defluviitaleaceae bacterium]|nr:hypothetical protein [Defluviitaleaceae bacterium]